MFTGTSTGASTGVSTGTSTGLLPASLPEPLPALNRLLYRDLNRLRGAANRCFADVECETLVRNGTEVCVTAYDVEKVSGETMTETMTIGGKNEKRDTTHRRIALRVAPPGIEPGLS